MHRVVLFIERLLEAGGDSLLQFKRTEPVKFGQLASEYLSELLHLEVLLGVVLDAHDQALGPGDGESPQSVSLVEVSVHELLHSLSRQLVLHALGVVL